MMNPQIEMHHEPDFDLALEIEWLAKAVSGLSDRETLILNMRYGLAGQEVLTLTEMGQQLGISPERVRQIEIRTLQKLRVWAKINE